MLQPKSLITNQALDRLTFMIVLIMATGFSFSFALFNVGSIVLMAVYIWRKIVNRETVFFDPFLDSTLVAFFVVAILSAVLSTDFRMSFQGIHKLFRYLFLFVACREIVICKSRTEGILWAFAVGGAIAGWDGLIQGIWGADPIRGKSLFLSLQNLLRLTACFPNPNALANYLAMIVPLVFSVWQSGGLASRKSDLFMSLMIPIAIVLGLTYSRPAALAIFINVLFFFVLRRRKGLGIILVVGIVSFFLLSHGSVKAWMGGLTGWQDFFYDSSRHYHHQAALKMIAARPWLGVGINTFDVNYIRFRVAGDPFTRWSAHHAYLQIASEMGVVGLFVFLMLLVGICRVGFQGYVRFKKDPFIQSALIGFLGGILTFCIIGFFESNFWQPRQTYFFWFWCGLMCAVAKGKLMKSDEKNNSSA